MDFRRRQHDIVVLDKDAAWIERAIAAPRRRGESIFVDGQTIAWAFIQEIHITETDRTSDQILPEVRALRRARRIATPMPDEWYVAREGRDVTERFLSGAPGTNSPRDLSGTDPENSNESAESSAGTDDHRRKREQFLERLYDETDDPTRVWVDPALLGVRIGIEFGPELSVLIEHLVRAGFVETAYDDELRLTTAGVREITRIRSHTANEKVTAEQSEFKALGHDRHTPTMPDVDGAEGRERTLAWRATVIGVAAAAEAVLLALLALYQPFSIWAVLLLSVSVILSVVILLSKLTDAKWFLQVAAWALAGALAIGGVVIKVTQTRPQLPEQSASSPTASPANGVTILSVPSMTPTANSPSVSRNNSPTASIQKPSPGAEVPLCTSASGYIENLPVGKSVWLFIQIPDKSNHPGPWYALAKLAPESNGHWSVDRLQIGDPGSGRPYWLELFLANSYQVEISSKDIGNVAYSSIPSGFDPKPLATAPVHRKNTLPGDSCS